MSRETPVIIMPSKFRDHSEFPWEMGGEYNEESGGKKNFSGGKDPRSRRTCEGGGCAQHKFTRWGKN